MTQTQNTTEQIIKDMRPGYGGQLAIIKLKPYYNGSPIHDLIKDESNPRNKHYYNIIQYGTNVGTICLRGEDYKIVSDLLNPVEFTRINCDTNGNSRFVCHFLAFIKSGEPANYELALMRSRQLGGRKFHNKQYGGGIVFQMDDGEKLEMSQKIREIANQ